MSNRKQREVKGILFSKNSYIISHPTCIPCNVALTLLLLKIGCMSPPFESGAGGRAGVNQSVRNALGCK